jgi:hypothetical protein
MLVGTAAGESVDVACRAAAGPVGTAAGESVDVACRAAAGPVGTAAGPVALLLRWAVSNAAADGLMLLVTLLLGP